MMVLLIKEIYFAGSLTSATIEELQKGLYRIMLKACTNAGPGPPTDPMEISDINMPRKSHQLKVLSHKYCGFKP